MALKELTKKINRSDSLKKEVSGTSFKKGLGKSKGFRKMKKLKVGDICLLKISALGPKGMGIDEYSNSYSIFVPNGNLGDTVKAKIIKINLKEDKYAIAQILEVAKKSSLTSKLSVQPEEVLKVNIEKVTTKGAGIVTLKDGYKLIVPNAKVGKDVKVSITRLKSKYGFAKLVTEVAEKTNKMIKASMSSKTGLLEGSKYTVNLPKVGKYFGNYVIVKVNNSVVFIKLNLGAKPGNKVRIKITKMTNKFAIAKIVQINPLSSLKKRLLVQNSIRQMVKNGMHLGEKAVKCNARMKNYVWLKKQGKNKNRPLIKKERHIINLLKTRRCLNKALTQLGKYAVKGRTFLFIGTKKPAAGLIARASLFSKTSFFVNTRWLGGMLTNWKTILKSISKIRPILKEKQKIVADILEKRQTLKLRLIKKALFLKKKSKMILNKGRFLIEQFKNQKSKLEILEKTKKLSLRKKQLVDNCYLLLSKRQHLFNTRRGLIGKGIALKENGIQLLARYKVALRKLTSQTKKLRELKFLLILSNEIQNIKNNAHQENKKVLNISYGKAKELTNNSSSNYNVLPNPPKEILNLILLTIKDQYETLNAYNAIQPKAETKTNALILSKVISEFTNYAPTLKRSIQSLENSIKHTYKFQVEYCQRRLTRIRTSLEKSLKLKNNLVKQLNSIKSKLVLERNIIRVVKTKLNYFLAQKRFIKFLPRLRYLATPLFTTKITETVKILMQKIVDPKLKYPIDNIYDDKLSNNTKKVAAARKKKWQRLEKYFGGISNMTKMTKSEISKNVAIVVGQKEEINAVRECQKLGIKMFNIVDTNCNPSLADHIIPANDDSRNSIKYVLNKFLVRIRLAQKLRKKLSQKLYKTTELKINAKANKPTKFNKKR